MRATYALFPLLMVAACATPRDTCLSDATAAARINAQLIAVTEATLARGFAVERGEKTRSVRRTCRGVTDSGEAVRVRCDDTIVIPTRRAVAVDLNAERMKLVSLKQRRTELAAVTDAAVTQCQRLYPE